MSAGGAGERGMSDLTDRSDESDKRARQRDGRSSAHCPLTTNHWRKNEHCCFGRAETVHSGYAA